MTTYTALPDLDVGDDITAANWNKWIHDNFMTSPAGLAEAKGDIFPSTGADACTRMAAGTDGQIVERVSGALENSWGYIPIGGIIMWSGALASLPANWQLCDGSNGTPDLGDYFIYGAYHSLVVGSTWGAPTWDIEHTHTAAASSAGGHTHTQGDTSYESIHVHDLITTGPSASVYQWESGSDAHATSDHAHGDALMATLSPWHTHTNPDTNTGGAHTHTVEGFDNQLSTAQDVRPPFYTLAFIMRLS